MPKVSVLMSVFNGEPFLKAALESVLTQTFQDFEFIIVDDGSTDGSAATINGYDDPRIIYVRQENRGVASALNRGLKIAKGEYIARQDADDISLPDRFDAQIQFLDAHPNIAVLGTGALLIDSQDRPFSRFLPFMKHKRLVAELLRGVCPLMHGSVMVRREAILRVGGYNPVFSHAQDVELWVRMSSQFGLTNLREILYHYRKHDRSITQEARIDLKIKAFANAGGFSERKSAEEWVRFEEEFNRNFKGSSWEYAFEAEKHLKSCQVALSQGKFWQVVQNFARAFRLNPGIAKELPGRIFRRLWRTLCPTWD